MTQVALVEKIGQFGAGDDQILAVAKAVLAVFALDLPPLASSQFPLAAVAFLVEDVSSTHQ